MIVYICQPHIPNLPFSPSLSPSISISFVCLFVLTRNQSYRKENYCEIFHLLAKVCLGLFLSINLIQYHHNQNNNA